MNVVALKDVSQTIHHHDILHHINLTVREGEFLTLLGPSGCGKTTLLQLISGGQHPTQGEIYIDNKNVVGLPPHQRHVHTVFQSYALFPHMTVYDNVAFGLRCQKKLSSSEMDARIHAILKMVRLEKYIARKPHQLSGGQQQRVAIARAIVNEPRVLLLDEPLSSLDYRLRKNMQLELKRLQRKLGITFIFVTHDQEEALSMSDRIVVMADGSIEQIGTPREVYEEPNNLTVAKFIGEVNIFDAIVVEDNHGKKLTVNLFDQIRQTVSKHVHRASEKVHILIRPEDIRVWGQSEIEDTSAMLAGTVEEAIYKGTTVDVMVRLNANQQVITASEFFNEDDDRLEYKVGENVWVSWAEGWEVVLPYEDA